MPSTQQPASAGPAAGGTSTSQRSGSSKSIPERVGIYRMGQEIGRGSFATVHRAYKGKSEELVAIKVVARSKMTPKLLENLESEINILKAVTHRNIVALEDCFKSEFHIFLIMEFCAGSDLSFYIKARGRLQNLDFVPRPGMFANYPGPHTLDGDGKMFWPHPPSGGIDEKVTRCFLGQLVAALKLLRSQNLIHRDLKPQNLLLAPPTAAEIMEGHPLGIPILKIADFGFARMLPAATMAETLCGSPLYMAPEILRYEKYDAKADLWSVGAVLYEMCVGRPPYKANNHVELLRKIERLKDEVPFPDELPPRLDRNDEPRDIGIPTAPDIKALIRRLLKRHPINRIDFPELFDSGSIWDGYMIESVGSSEDLESSLSPDVLSVEGSTGSGVLGDRLRRSRDLRKSREAEALKKLRDAVEKKRIMELEGQKEELPTETEIGAGEYQIPIGSSPAQKKGDLPTPAPPVRQIPPFAARAPTRSPSAPISAAQASSPIQRAAPASLVSANTPPPVLTPVNTSAPRQSPPIRRSEPKYYVSDPAPTPAAPAPPLIQPPTPAHRHTTPTSHPESSNWANPRPISSTRRISTAGISPEDPTPVTPSSAHPPSYPRARVSEGSPLASTPPITMSSGDRDGSALEGSDSVVGREYVMVEKQTVEVNALADEFDQASRANRALVRRPSSRISVVSRPVSALRPSTSITQPQPTDRPSLPTSYSPPFSMSTTPPFAIPPSSALRRPSNPSLTNLTRTASSPAAPQSGQMTVFPPPSHAYSPESLTTVAGRYSVSPSSLQTGALARALTNTAIRMIGQGANSAATALARATTKRRPTIIRTGEMDDEEEKLLARVEDIARKAFGLFELGDARLGVWNNLAGGGGGGGGMKTGDPRIDGVESISRRKSSSSSSSNNTKEEIWILRQQEQAAGEAYILYFKALGFIVKGTNIIQRYSSQEERGGVGKAGIELNEMVQWLRARFNECCEKAEWAKARCAEELPFIERLLHDKARETSRNAAVAELQGDLVVAEAGYETALWLLLALLDEAMYDTQGIKEEDRVSVEKLVTPLRTRLDALKRKIGEVKA